MVSSGFLGYGCALVEQRVNALLQLANAPADFEIEIAFERLVDVDQRLEMRPRQFSPHCRENLLIGVYLGQS